MMGWGFGSGMMGWGYGAGLNGYAGNGGFWWMGLVGIAIQLLFWGTMIGLGAFLFRRYSPRHASGGHSFGFDQALGHLQERYARGEIDSEEYQRRKADLLG